MNKFLITATAALLMVATSCGSKKEIGIGSTLKDLLDAYPKYKIEIYYSEMGSLEYNTVEEMLDDYDAQTWFSAYNDLAIFTPLNKNGEEAENRFFLLLKNLDNRDKYQKETTVWLMQYGDEWKGEVPDTDEMDEDDYGIANPAPPTPSILVGTWKAPVKRGHAAWLEIYEDGMAGLYLCDDDSGERYEIYRGTLSPADDVDIEGTGVDYLMEMNFTLEWYIYESEDGSPINIPDSYKGTYILRHYWDDGYQMLYVKAIEADPLFGKKEMNMVLTPIGF